MKLSSKELKGGSRARITVEGEIGLNGTYGFYLRDGHSELAQTFIVHDSVIDVDQLREALHPNDIVQFFSYSDSPTNSKPLQHVVLWANEDYMVTVVHSPIPVVERRVGSSPTSRTKITLNYIKSEPVLSKIVFPYGEYRKIGVLGDNG